MIQSTHLGIEWISTELWWFLVERFSYTFSVFTKFTSLAHLQIERINFKFHYFNIFQFTSFFSPNINQRLSSAITWMDGESEREWMYKKITDNILQNRAGSTLLLLYLSSEWKKGIKNILHWQHQERHQNRKLTTLW